MAKGWGRTGSSRGRQSSRHRQIHSKRQCAKYCRLWRKDQRHYYCQHFALLAEAREYQSRVDVLGQIIGAVSKGGG
jgi:hypothetical protein